MLDFSSIVISSRIRLARNIKNMRFYPEDNSEMCNNLVKNVATELAKLGNYKVYRMDVLGQSDAEAMMGKHLISKELIKHKDCGAVVVRDDEKVSIMINEEDHLREQCILKGLELERAFLTINEIDDHLSKTLNYAFSKQFGYLTSCVTNIGTGLRASVMLFLPALAILDEIEGIVNGVKAKGLTVRGELGEGSKSLGYIYQVSNAVSIGLSEREIVSNVLSAVKKICELEKEARQRLLKENPDLIFDLVMRAYGVLTNCYSIDWVEFMKLCGELKLGLSLDIIKLKNNKILDELLDICTDANLKKLSNKEMNESEISKYRAEYAGNILKKSRVK